MMNQLITIMKKFITVSFNRIYCGNESKEHPEYHEEYGWWIIVNLGFEASYVWAETYGELADIIFDRYAINLPCKDDLYFEPCGTFQVAWVG